MKKIFKGIKSIAVSLYSMKDDFRKPISKRHIKHIIKYTVGLITICIGLYQLIWYHKRDWFFNLSFFLKIYNYIILM